jgi:cytochrome P450
MSVEAREWSAAGGPGPVVPGPRPTPVLGAAGNMISFFADPLRSLERLHREYGDIASLALGTNAMVFVFTPEHNERVLADTDLFWNLDPGSSLVRMPLGSSLSRLFNGLANQNGERHQEQRRLLAPAFRRDRLQWFPDDVVALTERHLAAWREGDTVDVYDEMRQLTLAIAIKTFLGLDPEAGRGRLYRLLEHWAALMFSLPVVALPLDVPPLPYRRLLRVSRSLEAEIRGIVEQRRAGGDRPDVLSALLEASGEGPTTLSDDDLVGQIALLFMAGYTNTAIALAWTILLLALHPDVREELAGELTGAPPGDRATLLLERTIKESMRLLPPILWWSRVSTAPFDLGPYRLSEATKVVYSAFVTHRLPSLYAEPTRFRPERWLVERPGPYEYLPFSAGPRSCLGGSLALTEMRLVLATLLRRFSVTVPRDARVECSGRLLARPKHGLPMHVAHAGARAASRPRIRGNLRRLVQLD